MASTFSFDSSEFGDQTEGDAADEALADLEVGEETEEGSEDPELMDVDLRLETADYYRAILKHEFFDTESEASQIVDREIRSFIRERLEVLLGLRSPRQAETLELPFDEDEIQALKVIASKVLKKPGLVNEAPAVKKMATPAPAPKPEVKPALKPKPLAKKIPAPAAKPKTQAAKKPAPKPQAKVRDTPTQSVIEKADGAVRSAGPASQSDQPKVVDRIHDGGETQTYIDLEGKKVTLTEGEVIEEKGRRYLIARNGEGTLYRKDITGQITPKNRLQPMNEHQISLAARHMADQQLQMLDETTGMAVVASLTAGRE